MSRVGPHYAQCQRPDVMVAQQRQQHLVHRVRPQSTSPDVVGGVQQHGKQLQHRKPRLLHLEGKGEGQGAIYETSNRVPEVHFLHLHGRQARQTRVCGGKQNAAVMGDFPRCSAPRFERKRAHSAANWHLHCEVQLSS